MQNKNIMWTGIAVIIIIIAIVALKVSTSKAPIMPADEQSQVTPTEPGMPTPTPTTAGTAPKKTPASPAAIPVYSGRVDLSIQNFAFVSKTVTVKEGTTVVWKNNDTVDHTVTEDGGTSGPNSGKLAPGDGYPYTFPNAGTFTYHCSLHPSMTGTVVVIK
jgi:plastocyanin